MARAHSITSALGVAPLERCVDVVAERECDLWGALDDPCGTGHGRHRLEAGNDLVARRSGREGKRYGVLERVRGRIYGRPWAALFHPNRMRRTGARTPRVEHRFGLQC